MTDVITAADKLACAKRELAMRKNAYPRWIEQNKMSAGKATHEIACMEAIVADISKQIAKEEERGRAGACQEDRHDLEPN